MKNRFIVIDGMDGTGKGVIACRLHQHLYCQSKETTVLTTREPTSGMHGKKARKLLATDKDPKTNARELLKLYVDDRREHINGLIMPFLSSDTGGAKIVICDRYYYSTIAFQHTQGLPLDMVIDANKGFVRPDVCLLLDCPPKIALERIDDSRSKREKFEHLEFMNKLRKNFLSLTELLPDNIVVIDASKDVDFVFEQVKDVVDELF